MGWHRVKDWFLDLLKRADFIGRSWKKHWTLYVAQVLGGFKGQCGVYSCVNLQSQPPPIDKTVEDQLQGLQVGLSDIPQKRICSLPPPQPPAAHILHPLCILKLHVT